MSSRRGWERSEGRHSRTGSGDTCDSSEGDTHDGLESAATAAHSCSSWRHRIEPDPSRRQSLGRLDVPPAIVRLLLDRSSDGASRSEPSQDYLILEHTPSRLCFAVTDGVGSSFIGQLAAQFLARNVVRWLFDRSPIVDEHDLSSSLTAFLAGLTEEAGDVVASYPIPEGRSEIVLDILEQQRAYGSEAMIVCGRIDWPGNGAARIGLSWLGDAHLRVQLSDESIEDLSGQTSDRWSTRLGPRGDVQSWVRPTAEVARIIACSDGLLPELDAVIQLPDSALESRLARLAGESASDDIALVDIALMRNEMPPLTVGDAYAWSDPRLGQAKNEAVSTREKEEDLDRPPSQSMKDGRAAVSGATMGTGVGAEPVHAASARSSKGLAASDDEIDQPRSLRWWHTGSGHSLVWQPVPGADNYVVELASDPAFENSVDYQIMDTCLAIPSMAVLRTWARVRVCIGPHVGPWSESLAPDSDHRRVSEQSLWSLQHARPDRALPRFEPLTPSPRHLEPPAGLQVGVRMGRLSLSWNPVAGADTYTVVVESAAFWNEPTAQTRVPTARVEFSLSPGRYFVWLRASSRDRPGMWSSPAEVYVP